jgi:hypothetical protein
MFTPRLNITHEFIIYMGLDTGLRSLLVDMAIRQIKRI